MRPIKLRLPGTKLLICSLFGLCIAVLSLSSPARAQPLAYDHEVLGSASWFRPLGSGAGAFNLDANYGYYLYDPRWQVGLRQSYTLSHNDDAPDVWNAVTAPYINYHFMLDPNARPEDQSPVIPYLGTFVGAVWNDDDFTGTVGPQLGVKAYFTRSAFVGANYRYEWFFDDIGDAGETQDANHAVTLGIGYTWGADARPNP